MRSHTLALGLGSNLSFQKNSPLFYLRQALNLIKKIDGLRVLNVSSIYESDAQLPHVAQDTWNKKYLNAVVLCEIDSSIKPLDLLQTIKDLEKKLGRVAAEKWAPRLIDIDILYASHWIGYQDEFLKVPHACLLERPFALLPLLEVWPDVALEKPTWAEIWVTEKPFNTLKSQNHFWPEMIGILNITQDSFSDGGHFLTEESIFSQAEKHLKAGATILDIGAESTRPGAKPVFYEDEIKHLRLALSVMSTLQKENSFKISLDSKNAEVISKVLDKNSIDFINDVTGFSDTKMVTLLKKSNAKAFVMHSLSVPPVASQTLNEEINPCLSLIKWWQNKFENLLAQDVLPDQLVFDPGIGFGKTRMQNFYILKNLQNFYSIQSPILVGHSRKSFLNLFSDRPAPERDLETALVTKDLNLAYVQYLRVHDIETQKISLRSLS